MVFFSHDQLCSQILDPCVKWEIGTPPKLTPWGSTLVQLGPQLLTLLTLDRRSKTRPQLNRGHLKLDPSLNLDPGLDFLRS